jgi:hypothetical protein
MALQNSNSYGKHPFSNPQHDKQRPQSIDTNSRGGRAFFGYLHQEGLVDAANAENQDASSSQAKPSNQERVSLQQTGALQKKAKMPQRAFADLSAVTRTHAQLGWLLHT